MLDPIVGLVFEKGEQLGKFRDLVAPGEYEVDTTVRIRGKVTVAEDTEKRVPLAVPWQKVCAVLLSKLNGVTVEAVLAEALRSEFDVEGVTTRAQAAIEKLVESTKRPTRGAVRSRILIEEVAA